MQTSAEELLSVLARLVPDWDLSLFGNIEFLEGGYSNQNFMLSYAQRRYALRIPGPAQPYVDRHIEDAFYKVLPEGVGTNPVAFDRASGAMLTPWVEGRLLIDVWQNFNPQDLVKYLVDLHRKLPESERAYDVSYLLTHWLPDDSLARPVDFQPTGTPEVSITCHNDLNPWNIIVTDGGWITLDWEFVGRNDPLFDLISLHQGLGLEDRDLLGMAEQYVRKTAHPAQDPATLEDALHHNLRQFWLREYAWAEYQLSQGNQRKEIADQRDIAITKLELDIAS
ncbi:MAG: phosphotransferase [Pseudomonadota bacterium]